MEYYIDLDILLMDTNKSHEKIVMINARNMKNVRVLKTNKFTTTTFNATVVIITDTTNNYITTSNNYSQNDSVGVIVDIKDSELKVPKKVMVPLVKTESDMSNELIEKISKLLNTKYGINENMQFKINIKHTLKEEKDKDIILNSISKLGLNNAIRKALIQQNRKIKEKDIV